MSWPVAERARTRRIWHTSSSVGVIFLIEASTICALGSHVAMALVRDVSLEHNVMTLTFNWFLPTSGNSRTSAGRGHNLPLAPTRVSSRQAGVESGRDPGATWLHVG